MTDSDSEARRPDPALRTLDKLVGTWRISGDASGTVTYRWMVGGFFLAQEGELELYGHHNRFTEIIGHERPFGGEPSPDIKSRTYTAEGDTLDYVYESEGDTLIIWGGHKGSDSHYRGRFSADGNTLSGEWFWPGGGYQTTSTRQADTGP
ncbi:MAG TPA: hypothetical protein DGG94_12720 [Micromonosporaceae bacterium]|nr:hypothetical protein [Micromonosporaceae bacterium]HCU50642.1 hypothetical protein [Micromonosporaceae bacterium]